MRRLARLTLLLTVLLGGLGACSSGDDEPTPVSAEELSMALSGNTIVGEWVGSPYRQFFDVDGTTVFAPTGSTRTSAGKWRVDVASNTYESWWSERGGWEVYTVTRVGDTYFWTGEGVESEAFEIVVGDQL